MRYFFKVFKILLNILVFISIFCLIIGNYLFDYTLNPTSTKNIGEKIIQERNVDNKLWINQNCIQEKIKSYDNLTLNSYFIDNNSNVYIVIVHGYTGDASTVVYPAKKMKDRGYNVLIPELRGHGKSEGCCYGMGWIDRLDILKWIDYILSKDKYAKIVLYGISMGGATVMNVAGENPKGVVAVIEDCGYSNLWSVLQNQINLSKSMMILCDYVTYLRAGYKISDVNSIKQLKKTKIPILFIHGDKDDFVPVYMVEELYNAVEKYKEKLIIKGAGHASSFDVDSKLYFNTIDQFLLKYL